MATPQYQEHFIYTHESYGFKLTFKDANKNPIDLTGFEFFCKIYNVLRDVRATALITIPDPLKGEVFFVFSEYETRFMRGRLRCQVWAVGATGNIQFAIDGPVYIITAGDTPAPLNVGGQVVGALPTVDGAFA